MIYPENTIDKLGFAEIRERVRQKCLSQAARDLVERMQPLYKHQQIDLFLQQTHEFKEVLVNDSPLVMEQLFPIKPYAEKIRLEGAFLLEQEFHELRHSIQLAFRVLAYFKERRGLYPALEILFQELSIEKDLGTSIDRVIDD